MGQTEMDVMAASRWIRISPSKVRDLTRRVSGLRVGEALRIVDFSPRKGAAFLGKTLRSAIANAQNNAKLDADDLRIKEAVVEEGPRMKRHWPRARGSASPILRRLCHIRVVLTDGKKESGAGNAARGGI